MLIAIFKACGIFSWVGESDKMVESVDKDKLFQAKAFSSFASFFSFHSLNKV